MSKDDYDDLYADETDMLEFNENLPNTEARVAMEEDVDEAISPLMFGRTGRGSPVMELKPEYMLYRDAAQALRNEGIKDDRHLKNTKAWDTRLEQQKKEAEDEKQFDVLIDNMYKEMKKPVARSKAKSPSQKGGTRKRSSRRRSTRRSTRRSSNKNKRNKSSRRRR
jgi:hypothetical protein